MMILARENPFRSQCVEQIPFQPVGWTWDELDQRITVMNFRGAIVGPEGAGKTTLLDELERRFRQRGLPTLRWTLRVESPSLTGDAIATLEAHADAIVLLDGAEQLCPSDWRKLLAATRGSRGLIITSHRAGLLPTLVECGTSLRLLAQLLPHLLAPEEIRSLGDFPVELFDRFHGNLRLVLRALYDRLADGA